MSPQLLVNILCIVNTLAIGYLWIFKSHKVRLVEAGRVVKIDKYKLTSKKAPK